MSKITAIIPTFNEEANIGAAIDSVLFADEIIVVDSFSTDKTVEIAHSFGVKLLQHEYVYPAAQKNWTIPQATNEWIVLLDADEVIPPKLRDEILEKVKSNPPEAAFWIHRSNDFMGKTIKYSGWQRDKVIRLFKKTECRYNDKRVHEEIETRGTVGYLKHKIKHNTYKDIFHYLEKWDRYTTWSARDRFEKGEKSTLFHLVVKPWFRFVQDYFFRRGFLDGRVGFIVCILSSVSVFMRSLKVMQYQLDAKTNKTKTP